MIKVGQIDKTQYVLKRKKFHPNSGDNKSSLTHYNLSADSNNKIAPVSVQSNAQVSFRGLSVYMVQDALNSSLKFAFESNLKPVIKPIPKVLTRKVFSSLKNISETQYEYYQKIRKNYVNFIKLPTETTNDPQELLLRKAGEKFRKKNGISDEIARNISEDNLFYLPQKSLTSNFITQVLAPFRAVYNVLRQTVLPYSKEKQAEIQLEKRIVKEFSSLQGLIKSHEIWENGYRRMSGHQKWNQTSEFLIPDDVLYGKIQRRRNKAVDPNKGKYSSTSMMLGNRFISGLIYSYFLGTDAYNTTMRYSNDEKEAVLQRNSRVAQEFSRIGMNMYVQNLLFGTFEAAVNKSLATAMFVSGSTVAFSEVLGRKLVGKPIMPSDKETLDRLENEMNNKKGVLPAIGRLLTSVKKKDNTSLKNPKQPVQNLKTSNPANKKLFAAFANVSNDGQENPVSFKAGNNPSFKGFYQVENLVDNKKLSKMLKIVEQADSKTAESIKASIMKSVQKSQYIKDQIGRIPQHYEEIGTSEFINKVPVGSNKTYWGLWTTSFLVPVKFVKDLSVSTFKSFKNIVGEFTGVKNNELQIELAKLKKSGNEKYQEFVKHCEKRYELPVWKNSKLSQEEKELRLYNEFKEIKSKESEEIQGVKNILLWLEKQFKRENITINDDGTVKKEDIEKVKDLLLKSVMGADSSKHVEYDGNVLAQANINLSRAITTLFLMSDSYNLTMQYSNDNKKDAQKSASNRAAQELSRIGVSAYMLAFVHNLFSKLCNSSLGGAFALTAMTSSINDSLSRKVVGVPLTAKNQEELYELDKKNAKSKSPIKKALAYSIGKKSAMPAAGSKTSKQVSQNQYFANDYFITPKIS